MSNIEKYVPAGGMASIASKQANGSFSVSVSDDGPGIPRASVMPCSILSRDSAIA